MNLLFIGPLEKGSTTLQRYYAMLEIGIKADQIDTTISNLPKYKKYINKVLCYFKFHYDWMNSNKRIIDKCNGLIKYDYVWIEKGLTINSITLNTIHKNLVNCKIISYSCDDMMIKQNQSIYYLNCISLYDVHLTTKSYNIYELEALSAKKVLFFPNAYDKYAYNNKPITIEEALKWGSDVAFLGGFEFDRYFQMNLLAERGIKIKIWGPGWEKINKHHPNLKIFPGWVQAEDAAKIFKATKINLHFLRKIARDLQTTRTMEIPACGAFMLAERTSEHQSLFLEGIEAEYFSNNQELFDKINYYLINETEKSNIANAGLQRCLKDGYSYNERMLQIFNFLKNNLN